MMDGLYPSRAGFLSNILLVLVLVSMSPSLVVGQDRPPSPIPGRPRAPVGSDESAFTETIRHGSPDGQTANANSPAGSAPNPDQEDEDKAGREPTDERQEEQEEAENEEAAALFGPRLHQFGGVTGEYIYTGEVFTNAHGGLSTQGATRYRGNLDLVLEFDTKAMRWWPGGRLFVYGETAHGRTLTPDYVGDYQWYSNLDSGLRPDLMQVSEYWYRHDLVDKELWFKLGKQDANADFAYPELGGDFINTSFCWMPTAPTPTFPDPGLGVAVFVRLCDWLLAQYGLYDGAPDGRTWGFSTLGENGAVSVCEFVLTPASGADHALPATYRFGAWYHSGRFDEIDAAVPRELTGNHGFYVTLDQLLIQEPGTDGQGLGLFLQYGWAPADRNQLEGYYGVGLVYRGLLPSRDDDTCGVGMAKAVFSGRLQELAGLSQETAIELFYKAQVRPWASIQPDLQFIANPGGDGRDALVVGVRFETTL